MHLNVLFEILVVRYTTASSLALLVYDYLLTFADEKRLVWPSRFSLHKALFFLNRYFPFITTAGLVHAIATNPLDKVDTCRVQFIVFGSMLYTNYIIAESVLYLRAYAVWGRSRSILAFILVVLAVTYGMGAYFAFRFLDSVFVFHRIVFPAGCVMTFLDQIGWAAFIVLICSETIALLLLVTKAFRLSQTAVVRTLTRDGIAYYILILFSSVWNVIILRLASPPWCNFLLTMQAALHSILCNRLLLRIRGAYESSEDDTLTKVGCESRTSGMLDSGFMMTTIDGLATSRFEIHDEDEWH